ncbi:hypothetical protein, partial [Pseudomonas syringae group genomosp. 7]|uniref:hypothetical protein n=1 Tax=Pseudomonas syringae group genomosp. 7 TaxID=251699 RepID=UPI00376FCD06
CWCLRLVVGFWLLLLWALGCWLWCCLSLGGVWRSLWGCGLGRGGILFVCWCGGGAWGCWVCVCGGGVGRGLGLGWVAVRSELR